MPNRPYHQPQQLHKPTPIVLRGISRTHLQQITKLTGISVQISVLRLLTCGGFIWACLMVQIQAMTIALSSLFTLNRKQEIQHFTTVKEHIYLTKHLHQSPIQDI